MLNETATPIHALVISASLPPFSESSTLQLVARVEGFGRHAIRATFIAPEMRSGLEVDLLNMLPPSSTVLRTPPTRYDATLDALAALPTGRLWRWTYANTRHYTAVPDARAGWDQQVLELCASRADIQPDVLISSSGTLTAHLAAAALSQRLHVPWVADLGDPWSLVDSKSVLHTLRRRRNQQLEAAVLPRAAGLVFTTESTVAAYRKYFGDKCPPAIALPCYGYDVAPLVDDEPDPDTSHLVLAHIGAAHRSNRNLIPLIRVLAAAADSSSVHRTYFLDVVGPHSATFVAAARWTGLQRCRFIQRVSQREAAAFIARSHVQVVVGNRSPLQIPGKVYPSLGSGRPLLYIGQLPADADPTRKLLAKFSGIVFADNHEASLKLALQQIDAEYEAIAVHARARLEKSELEELRTASHADRFAVFVRAAATRRLASDTVTAVDNRLEVP
jgi:hypothetical protein